MRILFAGAISIAWAASATTALAECSKDDVIKLIDKGFGKAEIDRICLQGSAGAVAPTPADPKAKVLALLKLVDTDLPNIQDYAAPAQNVGLRETYNQDGRSEYSGFVDGIGVNATLVISRDYRTISMSDTVPPGDSTAKARFNTMRAAADTIAGNNGWQLRPRSESFTPSSNCQWIDYGTELHEAGNGANIATGKGLFLRLRLGGKITCRESYGEISNQEQNGGIALDYHWKR